MTTKEFVEGFHEEKDNLLELYFNSKTETDVSKKIESLNLGSEKILILREVIDSVLRDAYYTVLMGLDGEAQIGSKQEFYSIKDEKGNELARGMIEAHAWELFQNS